MNNTTGLTDDGHAALREIQIRQIMGCHHASRVMCREDWDEWVKSPQGMLDIMKYPILGERPYRQESRVEKERRMYKEEAQTRAAFDRLRQAAIRKEIE